EIRLAGMPAARRERAGAVADLDQVAEPVAWLVALRLVAVVAAEGWHWVETHGEPPAPGNGKRPSPVAVRRARFVPLHCPARSPCAARRPCPVRRARATARSERPRASVALVPG